MTNPLNKPSADRRPSTTINLWRLGRNWHIHIFLKLFCLVYSFFCKVRSILWAKTELYLPEPITAKSSFKLTNQLPAFQNMNICFSNSRQLLWHKGRVFSPLGTLERPWKIRETTVFTLRQEIVTGTTHTFLHRCLNYIGIYLLVWLLWDFTESVHVNVSNLDLMNYNRCNKVCT